VSHSSVLARCPQTAHGNSIQSYGEDGYNILMITLTFMFPDRSFDMMPFKPLSWTALLRDVLLPETAVCLIEDDLGVDREHAEDILKASQRFGRIFHSSDENPIIDDLISKTTRITQIEEARHRLWNASHSTLTFNAWVKEQEKAEAEFQVKKEEAVVNLCLDGEVYSGFKEMKVGGRVVMELLDD
jgi:hypothetical protein